METKTIERCFTEHYWKMVKSALSVLGDFNLAEDAASNAFESFCNLPDEKFESIENFEAYLVTSAKRKALTGLEKDKSRSERERQYTDSLDLPNSDDNLKDERLNLYRSLAESFLRDSDKPLWDAMCKHGKDNKAIGEILGLKPLEVKRKKEALLRRLKKKAANQRSLS